MKIASLSTQFLIIYCSLLIALGIRQTPSLAQTNDCDDKLKDSSSIECNHSISSPYSVPSVGKINESAKTDKSLNRKVYNYAIAHLGQQIANGECAFLIHNALVSAGAKSFDNFGVTDLYSDYIWGKLTATLTPGKIDISNVEIGDIIQFRDVSTYEKITKPDGSWKSRRVQYIHHTSIIGEINGNQLVLIHQNFGNDPVTKKTVQKSTLDLNSLQSGTLWIYRPTQ